MTNPRAQDLTTGSIPRHLARLSIPMVWGILSIVSMQVADVYFVSGLGHTQLEAMSFTLPISMVLFNLVMGLSIGTSSVVSRLIGARENDAFRHFIVHAITIAAVIAVVLAALVELMLAPIFNVLGAGSHHLSYIMPFMHVQLWGYVFITIPLVINAALRASGDTFTPSLIMVSVAIINIPLSYVLVHGGLGLPAYGMTGAGMANVTANAIAALLAFYVMLFKRRLINRADITFKKFGDSFRRLMIIAAPVGILNLMQPLTISIITAILASSGAEAVAAYGIIGRLEALSMVILMAVSIGASPLIGQNYGARRFDRMEQTIRTAIVFGLIWSMVIGLVLMVAGRTVAREFTNDPTTIAMVGTYFLIMGISRALPNIAIGWGTVWNALGKPQNGAVISLGLLGLGTIVPAYIGHLVDGWYGLFVGMMVGNLIMGMALHCWSAMTLKRFEQRTSESYAALA